MEFIGQIVAEHDPPGISRPRWIELIREHPNLARFEPREAINPFTREPILVYTPGDTVRVVVDGQEVGSMGWSPDESLNLINVCGDPTVLFPLACAIAESLGGQFKAYESSGAS
jgi:hypothetical protein